MGLTAQDDTRAVTGRSIALGALGALLIGALAGFHDTRISAWPPMVGMHLPIGAFLYIMLVTLGWNGLCAAFFRRGRLSAGEMTVITLITLASCYPPTSGLFRYFARQLVLPWYYLASGARTEWETFGVLQYLPAKLFPRPAPAMRDGMLALDQTVYRGFFTGLAQGSQSIGLGALPLAAWLPPLLYWAPLVMLMALAVGALAVVVHRQWAHHEQLRYPLAQVASAFVMRREGRGIPDLFSNRLFWWGATPVLALYLIEYLHLWFPAQVPGLTVLLPSLKTWSVPIQTNFPILKNIDVSRYLGWQITYFSVIGLAYFVSSEISLTMGLSAFFMTLAGTAFFLVKGAPMGNVELTSSYAGAYIGYALILAYTGRAYYGPLLKYALLGRRGAPDADRAGVFAARLLLASFAGFVALLTVMGLDWLVALCFGLLLMLLFLVFTRIVCETGIPFMQSLWLPGNILVTLFGPAALGPGPLVFVYYLGTILCQDTRECLMPFVATGLRMADDIKLRLTRALRIMMLAVAGALAIGFVASLWVNYNYGGMSADAWAFRNVPTQPFDDAARQMALLKDTGQLESSAAAAGFAKLKFALVDGVAMRWFGVGLAAVVAFSLLRFRFAWFPLHPVLFLVWGTYPANLCWSSFLIGWGIKTLVVRFGGGRVYQDIKPLFIGLIAGELAAAGISIVVEMIYYWSTGHASGINFSILPG